MKYIISVLVCLVALSGIVPQADSSKAQCDGPMCRKQAIYKQMQAKRLYRANRDPVNPPSPIPSEEALLGEPIVRTYDTTVKASEEVAVTSPAPAVVAQKAPQTRSYTYKVQRRQPVRRVLRAVVRTPVRIVGKTARVVGKTGRFVARGTGRVVSAPFRGFKQFAHNRRARHGCR